MPKKVDANQPQIVAELRQLWFLVHITSDLGRGFPDLVVGDRRTNRVFLFEVKNPEEAWKLTEREGEFHELWGAMVHVIETTEDALEIMGYAMTSSEIEI